jgi:hypothetical protein
MGLLVKPDTRKINVHGTPIELNEVYVRVEYFAHADGLTMDVKLQTYFDYSQYEVNEVILTDIPLNEFSVAIEPTEIQSIDTAFTYSIQKFIELGYLAEVTV